MRLAHLVWRRFRTRPLRTVLTLGAFGFSVGLIGYLFMLSSGLKQDWSPFMGQRVIVSAKSSMFSEKLPLAHLAKIADTPGVLRVTPMDFVIGYWKENKPQFQVPIQSADGEAFLVIYREAGLSPADGAAWLADPTGVVIGGDLKKWGWKVGDRIVLQAPVAGGVVEGTIRGVMTYMADNGVYLHRKYLEQLTRTEGQATMFWILAKSRKDVDGITSSINAAFENSPAPVRAMTEKQWQLMFLEMLGNVNLLFGAIGVVTAFALLLVSSNTLAMGARERRGESALLRVLGFARGDVFAAQMGEAAVFGVVGGLLGLAGTALLGAITAKAMQGTQMSALGALLQPNASDSAMTLLIAMGVALAAGVIPALGLSRRPVVELLRHAA